MEKELECLKGELGDHFLSQTRLKFFKNIFAMESDNFREPCAVFHADEKGPPDDVFGKSMGSDYGVHRMLPSVVKLFLLSLAVEFVAFKKLRQAIRRQTELRDIGFEVVFIKTAPHAENFPPGIILSGFPSFMSRPNLFHFEHQTTDRREGREGLSAPHRLP